MHKHNFSSLYIFNGNFFNEINLSLLEIIVFFMTSSL